MSHRTLHRFARHTTLALLTSLVLVARVSHADGDEPKTPPAEKSAKGLVPPKLVTMIKPVYPEAKRASGEKASVVVMLTIDASGKVEAATVATSGGADFDAEALAAAKLLSFEPATRDGKPIVAKIPFTFDFEIAPEAPVPATPKADAPAKTTVVVLRGVVRTPSEEPLPGATVSVTANGKTIATGVTDASGSFGFGGLPAGTYRVQVAADGFDGYASDEEVTDGSVTSVVYRPNAKSNGIDIEVKGDRPPREVTKHVLEKNEITKIPGTNGDAIRSIENLPGVARPPGVMGLLIVRGSGPADTQVFLDGTPIPIIYHFGGLTSVVPTEMIEKLDFLPGNFGPEYGRVMGGIVDVGLRSPRKQGLGGVLQLDLIDGRVVAEGALSDDTRILVAGRRSWVDAWLGPVMKSGGVSVSTAPVYYDYQAVLEHDFSSKTTGRIAFLGSSDRLALTFNSPQSSDPAFGGDFNNSISFYRVQARLDTRFSKDVRWINTLAYGDDRNKFNYGDLGLDLSIRPLTLRSDLRAKLSSFATAVVGLDLHHANYDVTWKFPPFDFNKGDPTGPLFGRPSVELTGKGSFQQPAAYAMLELAPAPGVKLLPGVRIDYSSSNRSFDVDPRFAARWDIVRGFPRTTLKGGVGIFHQAAQDYERTAPFGTPSVKSNKATHTSLGFEQEITREVELSVEGFYKKLENLVSRHESADSTRNAVTYRNEGSGRIYGGEMLLRYKPDSRFFGWIAYTLSRSERREAAGQPLQVYLFDQTHILTALGSVKLGRGWELGARWRYVTGSPYTPNVGGVMDFDAGVYSPIQGAPNSARNEAYHKLDVRIDKTWTFQTWKLAAYLDVQNAYNRKNPEGRQYNYDFSKSQVLGGLPILPVIGLRGEL